MGRTVSITFKSALFITLLGLVAWMTGNPFIFPSLGPTAYILAFDRRISNSATVVIGGHTCGVIGGLASYHLLVKPYDLMTLTAPLSTVGFSLALGAIIAIALTAFLMVWLQVSHPPACATTLIISLGILPRWTDGLVILFSVVILYSGYWIFQKLASKNW